MQTIIHKLTLQTILLICLAHGVWAQELTKKQQLINPTNNFSKPEKFEHYPGGTAGRFIKSRKNIFLSPSKSLPTGGGMDYALGKSMFKKLWAPAPSATLASNGLGPLFNARSCLSCHIKNGRGHVPDKGFPNEDANSMLIRLSIKPQTQVQKNLINSGKINNIAEPIYGGQLQDIGATGFMPEAKISVTWQTSQYTFADGEVANLRKPKFKLNNLAYGALHKDIQTSPRIATQMVGMGLIDTILSDDILANADIDDIDGDGISGKANMVWDIEADKLALGRFGWKAGQPNLKQQVAAAFSGDVGINSPLFPNPSGDCTLNQPACLMAPNGNQKSMQGFELSNELLNLTSFFNANLAVPNRKKAGNKQVLKGKALFYKTGCISCHKPKFVTGNQSIYPNLHNELIWPYSDFLLHDMGDALADNRPEGKASGTEWRTPPLWGVGAAKHVGKKWQLLHDGRARNITEAILWHGGEGETAKTKFTMLNKRQRQALVAFVESL